MDSDGENGQDDGGRTEVEREKTAEANRQPTINDGGKNEKCSQVSIWGRELVAILNRSRLCLKSVSWLFGGNHSLSKGRQKNDFFRSVHRWLWWRSDGAVMAVNGGSGLEMSLSTYYFTDEDRVDSLCFGLPVNETVTFLDNSDLHRFSFFSFSFQSLDCFSTLKEEEDRREEAGRLVSGGVTMVGDDEQ